MGAQIGNRRRGIRRGWASKLAKGWAEKARMQGSNTFFHDQRNSNVEIEV